MANDEAPRRSSPVGTGAAPDDATIDIRRPRAAAAAPTPAAATTTAAHATAATFTATAAAPATTAAAHATATTAAAHATAAIAAATPDAATGPIAVDHTLTSPHPDPRGVAFGPGDRIHRYQLTSLLGIGGMGVVYAADDLELHRPVAIKLLHQGGGADAAERALREARAMAQFRHANVVPLFDVGVHHGHVYLVMPLLEEGTLGGWLRATRRPWRAIVRKFALAARGLEAAHAAGLVHRDFKPENVLLGADDEVRVSDFGLVSANDDLHRSEHRIEGAFAATQTRLRGTPAYMAPEQLDGTDVDARADQFAFCVALHAALYGHRPFAEADADPLDLGALRDAIAAGRIRPPSRDRRVPRWLAAAIARGLHNDPADRWPSMAALVAALDRGLARTRWGLIGLGVGLAALTGIAIAVALGFGARRTEPLPTLLPDVSAPTFAGAGENQTPLTSIGQIDASALSPDGLQIAIYSRGVLSVIPSAGGDARILYREENRSVQARVSWSPNGKHLLLLRFDLQRNEVKPYIHLDIDSNVVSELTHVPSYWGTFVGDDEIVSAYVSEKTLFFVSLDERGPTRKCTLPGTYQWIWGFRAIQSTLYVLVSYPSEETAWLATDRSCAKPIRVCDGDALPLSDHRCLALTPGDQPQLIEKDRNNRQIGPTRRAQPITTDIVGVRPDGAAIVTTRSRAWRLAELSATDSQQLAAGTGPAPRLVLAPDRRRVARTERSRGGTVRTYIVRLDDLDDRSMPIEPGLAPVAWSPDGTTLAGFDGVKLVLIDAASRSRREVEAKGLATTPPHVVWLDDRRVAYPDGDNRTFRWIDVGNGETGPVLDATQGWTFSLARSQVNGSLAVRWNRDVPAIWVIPKAGEPTPIANTYMQHFAWSLDDHRLWLANTEQVETYDPLSRLRHGFRTLDLPTTTALTGLIPIAHDRVLLETQDTVVDLARIAP